MPVTTLRIIESDAEASLHPRDIWNHWKKHVIWDPRSYYGVLEFGAALIALLSVLEIQTITGYDHPGSFPWYAVQKLWSGILLGLGVSPLHWYSNHRQSAHLLTRVRTHLYVLLFLGVTLFISQIFLIQEPPPCYGSNGCEVRNTLNTCIWLSILFLFIAAFIVYTVARNPRKDPVLAELPSPTAAGIDFEDETQAAWASVNVADGIEDDSAEPEGQLRL
ncbi:hypothetical protein GALMADRAFT_223599 [Galerina marginata CBS 339.88]|uniref:MARVEL domain-containing protein n=1 Tax=Galerina marginata (strain CBS 339.88) TaxID=685588 RepID=A0A067TAJ3_GALM3|nr:hypothetical protein GALMADRAFT_223599 [Galerina marginata CBS 339.88]